MDLLRDIEPERKGEAVNFKKLKKYSKIKDWAIPVLAVYVVISVLLTSFKLLKIIYLWIF